MATNKPQDDFQKTALRLPRDLHSRIHEAAVVSGRSYNAEIVARLQQTFAEDAHLTGLAEVPASSLAAAQASASIPRKPAAVGSLAYFAELFSTDELRKQRDEEVRKIIGATSSDTSKKLAEELSRALRPLSDYLDAVQAARNQPPLGLAETFVQMALTAEQPKERPGKPKK